MSSSELLTDAYLIELLQRDAQRKPTRRSDAPKPNTRFLRNIVRDVDSHNSALKAKEEADARARQWRLRGERQPDEHAREEEERRRRPRERSEDRCRKHKEKRRSRSRSRSPRRKRDDGVERRRKHRDSRPRSRSKSRSRSPRRSSHRHRHHHHHHHHRSERPQREDSPPPPRPNSQRKRLRSTSSASSDPLEDLLGPQPLPPNQSLPRGRGAFKTQNSGIETRFREGYDPKADVREEDDDNWDRGLEAVRDRAKWRQNGAERLRAAGFTEQEVQNWESGTAEESAREKDVRDVTWMKQGEGVREWDRGKGEEGKADWIGRLT